MQVRLSSVYTALLTQRSEADAALEGGKRWRDEPRDRRLSALDVLNAKSRLVLLGGPGSGKSTFVNFVALSMAGELLGVPGPNLATLTAPLPKEQGDDQDPTPQHWEHGPLLPVPVVLRDLASQLPPPGTPVKAKTLWRFVCGRLKQATLEDFAPHLKQWLLHRGGLVLLDGLDEVPDAQDRRGQIKQAVQDFAATFSRCRFLVTSRTYAYQRQDWKLDGFAEVHLLPFTPGQIRGFVDAWYAHMVELLRLTKPDAADRAELARGEPGRWREVALLAGAKASRGSSLNAWALAETLCPKPPPDGPAPTADHWGALLAGRVLVECADLAKVAARNEEKLARVRDWQLTLLRGDALPATERTLAGRSLATLGDPRPEVTSLDGMQFCLVPPGPFVMGDDAGSSDEKPQHTVDLAYPYFIGRFPVTLAQWREYLQLSDRPADDERSLRGRENDPVLYVTWHDALRFCAFLTQAWRKLLPKGFVVTLPSEPEWEKAARGGEQVPTDSAWATPQRLTEALEAMPGSPQRRNPFPTRDYPWEGPFDADRANAESAIGETSAVGCYPTGAGPYGCEEMSGNVWEWTRSLWGKKPYPPDFVYPYNPDDADREDLNAGDEIWRVVRGGSWYLYRDDARCASRYGVRPGGRYYGPGFSRGVACCPCSSAPSSGLAPGRDDAPVHPCRTRSGNAGRSARAGLSAEVKEEEQRQTGLVRARAARQGDTGASPAPGTYQSRGTARPSRPPLPAPISLSSRWPCKCSR